MHRAVIEPTGKTVNVAPICAFGEPVEQQRERDFAVETNNRVESGNELEYRLVIEARVMPAERDMRADSGRAHRRDDIGEFRRHVLEDQRQPDHIRIGFSSPRDERFWIGIKGEDVRLMTGGAHRCAEIAQAQIVLVLKADEQHALRPARRPHWQGAHDLLRDVRRRAGLRGIT